MKQVSLDIHDFLRLLKLLKVFDEAPKALESFEYHGALRTLVKFYVGVLEAFEALEPLEVFKVLLAFEAHEDFESSGSLVTFKYPTDLCIGILVLFETLEALYIL